MNCSRSSFSSQASSTCVPASTSPPHSTCASAVATRSLAARLDTGSLELGEGAQPPLSELAESESVRIAWERATKAPLVQGEAEGGAPHGDWSIWREDGSRAFAGQFSHGQPDGRWTWWHEGGAVRAQGLFLAGTLQGSWREYHADGTLAVAWDYEAGELSGPALEFWSDGAPKSEGSHDKGRRDGRWVTWHENGELRARGHVVRAGKRLIITTAEVVHLDNDGGESPCALMQQTLAVVPKSY